MYGWILDCFQYFVEARYGEGAWLKIMKHPYEESTEELPDFGGFVRHNYYPDELSVRVFVTASQLFEEDFNVVLEAYGVFFIELSFLTRRRTRRCSVRCPRRCRVS